MIFEVPGMPQGKARARTFYNSRLGRSQSITPEKTVLYENLVVQSYLTAEIKQKWLNKEPLEIYIYAYFPIVKSATKKQRVLMANGELYPTKKPDADNIAKVICDALNGIAYHDDTQVVNLNVRKLYTEGEPKVTVELYETTKGEVEGN